MELNESSTIIRVRGPIDFNNSPRLRESLRQETNAGKRCVIVDLSDVAAIDSSGVGTLLEFKRELERTGGQLVLACLRPRVKSVLELTRLDNFSITDKAFPPTAADGNATPER